MKATFDQQIEAKVQHLISAVLTGSGETDFELRRTIEARSSEEGGGGQRKPIGKVPSELETYVDKVAKHAYRVVDNDIEELGKAGYSEDAIFEITLSAALGAGIGRLERGLAALKGASSATK